jgi:hypothetical protein
MKWIFSDISSGTFNWKSIVSKDDGETWVLVQKMIANRKAVDE